MYHLQTWPMDASKALVSGVPHKQNCQEVKWEAIIWLFHNVYYSGKGAFVYE
jgi:hypothetical protein